MVGLAILKQTYDLSDEVLCERWVENPYYPSEPCPLFGGADWGRGLIELR